MPFPTVETESTFTYPIIYVEVASDSDRGFWEIDLDLKKALFRGKGHTISKNDTIHVWDDVHQTITDYLKNGMGVNHVKEVIPGIKYVWSDDMFCSHYSEGVVATDPTQKVYCTKSAEFFKGSLPLCAQHANVNF